MGVAGLPFHVGGQPPRGARPCPVSPELGIIYGDADTFSWLHTTPVSPAVPCSQGKACSGRQLGFVFLSVQNEVLDGTLRPPVGREGVAAWGRQSAHWLVSPAAVREHQLKASSVLGLAEGPGMSPGEG